MAPRCCRVKVPETLVGALILMMVFNYMTIRGIPGTWQTTATGLLAWIAVAGRLKGATLWLRVSSSESVASVGLVSPVRS